MLIGLTGMSKSGKSTAALALIDSGFVRVKMADTLKDMTFAFLQNVLPAEYDIDSYIEGDNKETPIDLLQGKTSRFVMQTIGTEWGRELFFQDIWTTIAFSKIKSLLEQGKSIVIDDIRFENECTFIHRLGGQIAAIHNPKQKMEAHHNHVSETKLTTCDMILVNNFDSAEQFQNYVKEVFLK